MLSVNMENLFWQHGMKLLYIVDEWRRVGIRVNRKDSSRKELTQRMLLDECQSAWDNLHPFVNWASPKQLTTLLYDELKLPTQFNFSHEAGKGVTKTRTSDKEALEILTEIRPDVETIKILTALRSIKQELEVLSRVGSDGRVHPKTMIHRSESGRLAQRDPTLYNVTENSRDIFLPDCDDCLWLHIDYSQLEMWITAWYARCQALLKIKETGEYIHGIVYEDLFKRPFFEPGMPKTKKYRLPNIDSQDLLLAKIFPHGVDYGLTEKGISERYGWPIEQARAYRDNWLRDKPEIPRFHSWVTMQIHRHGILRNVFGRVRRFSLAEKNKALSFLGQSTALDVLISKALLPLSDNLRDYKCDCSEHHSARVMMGVHDSVEISTPKKWIEEVARVAMTSMTSPVSELDGFSLPAEASAGPNWRDQSTTGG
jgi:DNA polymerase-1